MRLSGITLKIGNIRLRTIVMSLVGGERQTRDSPLLTPAQQLSRLFQIGPVQAVQGIQPTLGIYLQALRHKAHLASLATRKRVQTSA